MELVVLLGVLVAAYAIVAPALGLAAFLGNRRLRAELRRLEAEVRALRGPDEFSAPDVQATAAPPAGGWPTATEWQGTAAGPPAAEPLSAEPAAPSPTAPEPDLPEGATAAPAEAPPPAAPAPVRASLEERLTARWLVWLGAAAMALAAVFLVKHALDRGLLGPAARVLAGLLLGTGLAAAGEWLRRRPMSRAIAASHRDYVPAALTAAGLFALFAAVYAASALYALIGPGLAYVALAAIALAAVALALLHGPFVALLGLVAGYATPLLVPSADPNAWAVFGFMAVLTAALVALVRWTGATALAWAALAGAVAWPLFWLDVAFGFGDAAVVGSYLLVIAVLGLVVAPAPATAPREPAAWRRWPLLLVLVWTAAVGFCLLALAVEDGWGTASLVAAAVFAAGGLAAARLLPGREPLLVPVLLLVVALFALWPLPHPESPVLLPPEGPWGEPWLPAALADFAVHVALHAALFGLGGFLALRGAARPVVMAGVSAGVPVALLAVAYWRLADFAVDLRWTTLGLALAGLAVLAASRAPGRVPAPARDDVLGLYAAAVTAALALAATTALREAWLSVALALELPALGWIALRLASPRLRQLAAVLAGVVLVRLVLNPFVLDYASGQMPGLGWVLYGYGLPALAFLAAARLFHRRADDWLVALLDGGAIAFTVLLVTLEIQLLVSGALRTWPDELLALGLQSTAWLVVAAALARQSPWFARPVVAWSRRLLVGLAIAQSLVLQAGVLNPLWWPAEVGPFPLVNLLLVAYALPGALLAWHGRHERARPWLARAASLAALVLAFVYVSLSVRHAFHGSRLDLGAISNAEWFSYSAAWLAFAAVLLALGIRRRSVPVRWASLVLVMLTVAKVFLLDMDDLEGLWRVASFLGLGLSLVAIGYVYQRLVLPLRPPPRAGPAAAPEPTPSG